MKKKSWTEEDWSAWLQSCRLDREVAEWTRFRLDGARREIEFAWNASLGMGCTGATLTVLMMGWPLREKWASESSAWGEISILALVANAVVLLVWFAVKRLAVRVHFRSGREGSSHEYLSYQVRDDIAAACGTAALQACTKILHQRETRLAALEEESTRTTAEAIQSAIAATWKQPTMLDLEANLLERFKGGHFVATDHGDTQVFMSTKCARCERELLAQIRSLAIEPVRAQAAGLTRAQVVPERPAEVYFRGTREQFAKFFGRDCNEVEATAIRLGLHLDSTFCSECATDGAAAGVVHPWPRDPIGPIEMA